MLIGDWKHPLEINLSGEWNPTSLVLKQMTGSFFKHPFSTQDVIKIQYLPKEFIIPHFSFQIAEGTILGSYKSDENETNGKLSIQNVPLDIFSLNPLDLAINGSLNLDASIEGPNHHISGRLKSSLQNISIPLQENTPSVNANGTLFGILDQDTLSLNGDFFFENTPFFQFDVKLPMNLQMNPLQISPLLDKPLKGNISLSGHIENWLDFFDLGTHRLEGMCQGQLTVGNTLRHPLMQGYCHLDKGYYQNYYTGTELNNMEARFSFHQNAISLNSLTATDAQDKGQFLAEGIFYLNLEEHFPFEYAVSFNRFNWASQDLITSEAQGSLKIKGNLKEAIALGNVNIIETDISIPPRLARALPELQVVYKNTIVPQNLPPQIQTTYPLHLDLQVDAPDGIFISGRGLESEWKGNFQVKGTQTAIETFGKIELIKGSFLFSGREFKLKEGSLLFSGKEHNEPYLSLAATINIKDIEITAHLKGPINNPQVTFQSSPPLPMGTIMSYLLFGQDLAEINSFQALQLANSLATLAGEGPNILESTRKSLGIDQISILTIPSKTKEGEDTIAIQVGKYVTEGVLVSYAQGAEDSSTNIKIEIEGSGGFSFLLESDQIQEQGKFTIRWGHTY